MKLRTSQMIFWLHGHLQAIFFLREIIQNDLAQSLPPAYVFEW
jgi:hypothetical protein